MLINREAGWLIVTPPKTASTSLSRHFAELYSGHQHDHDLPADWTGRVYVTCRNPFDRAVSLWQHRLYDLQRVVGGKIPELAQRHGFADFLAERPSLNEFFGPQSFWVGNLRRDGELHTETLDADLRAAGLLSGDEQLPRYNRTKHDPYESYYTPELAERVAQDFSSDFAMFGYQPVLPSEFIQKGEGA